MGSCYQYNIGQLVKIKRIDNKPNELFDPNIELSPKSVYIIIEEIETQMSSPIDYYHEYIVRDIHSGYTTTARCNLFYGNRGKLRTIKRNLLIDDILKIN